MVKLKKVYQIKREKLIFSYLVTICSIFGIFFYIFIIVNGFDLLASIISLILGVSLIILLLKGKLSFIKKSKYENPYLGLSILHFMLGVLNFLIFIISPYRNAIYLILGLEFSMSAVYLTLLYVRIPKISPQLKPV